MPRYKATIEYFGPAYAGFQIQPNVHTVAGALETALQKFSRETISINCSGRTDAGVHAKGQVIDFFLSKSYPLYKITEGINFYLREANELVAVQKTNKVPDDFHSRYAAREKTYEYLILNRKAPSPILSKQAWHVRNKLDLSEMKKAASYLESTHDFTSFRSADCQADNPVRTIDKIQISKSKDLISFKITSRAFLYNQVRITVGTLVEIASGRYSAEHLKEIIAAKNRRKAGQTAPAHGLYLLNIKF